MSSDPARALIDWIDSRPAVPSWDTDSKEDTLSRAAWVTELAASRAVRPTTVRKADDSSITPVTPTGARSSTKDVSEADPRMGLEDRRSVDFRE
jgi:hypothetical protein